MKTSKKMFKAVVKTINKTNPPSSLEKKLKTTDPEIQHYVVALKAENLKCTKKIAKLQAENITLNSRITVLEDVLRAEKEKPKIIDYIKQMKKERSE